MRFGGTFGHVLRRQLGRHLRRRVVVSALCGMLSTAATAEPLAVGDLVVEQAWARASIGTARLAAAYLTVTNGSTEPDRLLEVTSPVAGMATIHAVTEEGGVSAMRPAGELEIAPGTSLVLEPGGLHVMLMDLREPLIEGDTVRLDLVFERNGAVAIDAAVAGPGAMEPPE